VKGQQPVAGRTWGDMSSLLSFFFHTSALSSPSSSDLQSSAMTASGHRTTSAHAIVIAAIAAIAIVVAREGWGGEGELQGGGRKNPLAHVTEAPPARVSPPRPPRFDDGRTAPLTSPLDTHTHAQTDTTGGAAYQHQQQGTCSVHQPPPASRVRCLVWNHATRQRGLHCSTGGGGGRRRRGWGCVRVRTWWAGWWAA
jgi:hypothetical protein